MAEYFELDGDEAREITGAVGAAVATWREVATGIGLTPVEIERMASAFEHKDLRKAAGG